MLCGGFRESSEKRHLLEDVDARAFSKVLDLWCGRHDDQETGWSELKMLAEVANRLEITEVLAAVEEAMAQALRVEVCADLAAWSGSHGLKRLEAEAKRMLKQRFREAMATPGFLSLDDEALRALLLELKVGGASVSC
jgi:hypothetical protein